MKFKPKLTKQFGHDKILVGLVLRYSQHARSVRELISKNLIGDVVSMEASEHIMPWHGGFFMRNWRRKEKYSGGFMLEKCCHDIDFYSMIARCRPSKIASFGGNLLIASFRVLKLANSKFWGLQIC